VPNFLEAQSRSKVSRVKADMRSLAAAIEMYKVDSNYYPPDLGYREWPGFPSDDWRNGLGCLTSPVAYFGAIPIDPFGGVYAQLFSGPSTATGPAKWYYYGIFWRPCYWWPGPKYHGRFTPQSDVEYPRHPSQNMMDGEDCWHMISSGPWRWWYLKVPSGNIDGFTTPYDPTNGTISYGSIARWGP
jgi:hypothetical protein